MVKRYLKKTLKLGVQQKEGIIIIRDLGLLGCDAVSCVSRRKERSAFLFKGSGVLAPSRQRHNVISPETCNSRKKPVAETSNFAGIILYHPSHLSLSLSKGRLCDYYLPAEVLNIICKCGNNVGGTRGDET
jgi:hypothetical protein